MLRLTSMMPETTSCTVVYIHTSTTTDDQILTTVNEDDRRLTVTTIWIHRRGDMEVTKRLECRRAPILVMDRAPTESDEDKNGNETDDELDVFVVLHKVLSWSH